jgi:hypothetical protein
MSLRYAPPQMGEDPPVLQLSVRKGVVMMVRKVLGILLCVGIVSLVSGCYCYPPGYYPRYGHHHWRYSYAYPSQAYAQHYK